MPELKLLLWALACIFYLLAPIVILSRCGKALKELKDLKKRLANVQKTLDSIIVTED